MARILAIDDEAQALRYLADVFGGDHDITTFIRGEDALREMRRVPCDLVLVDLDMPPPDGFEILRRVQQIEHPVPVIVVSAMDRARAVIDALRFGARDFVMKPATPEELRAPVERILAAALRRPACGTEGDSGFAGHSPAIELVRQVIPLLAKVRETVLIVGETGTGKELVARALHEQSPRHAGPFVAYNMAATPPELAESVFFGHVRGAFSGATSDRTGLFEQARGGTLFLDEIDSFPLALQAKLLRVLESGCLQRVGSGAEIELDVRVVAASSVDLAEAVARGVFRADLLYRLNQLDIHLPALRNRREDIPDLVEQFLAQMAGDACAPPGISPAAMQALMGHSWPGNCRELRHAVRSAAILAGSCRIEPAHLPGRVRRAGHPDATQADLGLAAVEQAHIRSVLDRAGGNLSLAARLLGIDRGTLARKLRAFECDAS